MKQLYRLTPEGRKRAKWAMVRQIYTVFLIGELLLFALTMYLWEMSWTQIGGLVIALVMMLGLFVFVAWNNKGLDWAKWGVYVDDEQVYLTEFPDSPRLRKADVTRVRVSRSGMIVYGREFGHQLFIPAGVEDYEVLERRLSGWAKNT